MGLYGARDSSELIKAAKDMRWGRSVPGVHPIAALRPAWAIAPDANAVATQTDTNVEEIQTALDAIACTPSHAPE